MPQNLRMRMRQFQLEMSENTHRHAQTYVNSHLMPQIHNFACPTSINSHLKTLHASSINKLLQQQSKAPHSPKVVEEVTRKVPLELWSS